MSSWYWERIAPKAKSEASVSMTKGFNGFAWAKIGAEVKAFLRCLKDFSASSVQVKGLADFWVSLVKGAEIPEKFSIKMQ